MVHDGDARERGGLFRRELEMTDDPALRQAIRPTFIRKRWLAYLRDALPLEVDQDRGPRARSEHDAIGLPARTVRSKDSNARPPIFG
jgi:hypothetical protein